MGLTCCNDRQTLSLLLIALYIVLIVKLWRAAIIHPFKILMVFLHELGHAIACWLTCGRVEGMEVDENGSGVTTTKGGVQWIIVTAGCLGSALWGMALITASARFDGTRAAACVLMFFLALFIFFGSSNYLRVVNLGFIAFLVCLLVIDIYTKYHPLWYAMLFMGVMSCLLPIFDIWDDTMARHTNETDAAVLANFTHTSSRIWGFIWALFALAALAGGVLLHLHNTKREGGPLKFSQTSKWTKTVFGFTMAAIAIGILHTVITRRIMLRKRSFGSTERSHYVSAA